MVALDDLPVEILHHLVQSCNKSDVLSLRLSCSKLSVLLRSSIDKFLVSEIRRGSQLHLHRAVATPDTQGREMVGRLLGAKAPIEQRDKRGETALHVAARHGNLDGVNSILDAGADVDALSFHEWTPLHLACRYGYVNIARVLLESGADFNKTGSYGRTALDFAIHNGHGECQKMLSEYGADTADCHYAARTLIGVVEQHWGIYKRNVKVCLLESSVPTTVLDFQV